MKLIFLDFDGVLNNPGCYADPDGTKASGFRTRCALPAVEALNYITEQTGALLVISSTWRYAGLMFCREYLATWGISAKVVAITSDLRTDRLRNGWIRGDEIQHWLKEHKGTRLEPEAFVILDDDSDMGDLGDRLVRTAGHIGLTMDDARKAVELLSDPDLLTGCADDGLSPEVVAGVRRVLRS